eukprot:3519623-Pyramimonas_sp.AAC.1
MASEATARRQASSDASFFVSLSPIATSRRPSPGARLFGKVRVHRQPAPEAANSLQLVTARTKAPPYS